MDYLTWLKPFVILEIGTGTGGSMYLMSLKAHDNAILVTIDGNPKPSEHLIDHIKSSQTLIRVDLDSHDQGTLWYVRNCLPSLNVDVLFIDGDHSYKGVKQDFEMYGPLVEKGIIVFHDICQHHTKFYCKVDRFWKEIKREYNCIEIIGEVNQNWGGLGIICKGLSLLA